MVAQHYLAAQVEVHDAGIIIQVDTREGAGLPW